MYIGLMALEAAIAAWRDLGSSDTLILLSLVDRQRRQRGNVFVGNRNGVQGISSR